jgi:hypothetical protein
MLENQVLWIFHQLKSNTTSFGLTYKWRNKDNSFFTNPCKIASFDVIAPKMEMFSSLIIVGSILS